MDVSALSGGSTSLSGLPSTTLGKDDFLKLLLTQLGNQDPLNPTDDKEFIAQLAQFSGLEQAMETNKQLQSLQLAQSAMTNTLFTGLIGKKVLARSETLHVQGAPPTSLDIRLSQAATDVTVRILDKNGDVVREIDAGAQGAGMHTVQWDGLDADGNPLANGDYKIEVVAKTDEGAAVDAEWIMHGRVTGIEFTAGRIEVVVGGTKVLPGDILSVEDNAVAPATVSNSTVASEPVADESTQAEPGESATL